MRLRRPIRSGTTAVESALVFPIVFLLTLGVIITGLGVYRYQEMSSLARRAARYASVRGSQYARDTGRPAATPADIYNEAVRPHAVGLDLSRLTYTITYNTTNSPSTPIVVNNTAVNRGNTVTVTLRYTWVPEGFLPAITLTSTSVMPMSY